MYPLVILFWGRLVHYKCKEISRVQQEERKRKREKERETETETEKDRERTRDREVQNRD